jgi:hypothetical protein
MLAISAKRPKEGKIACAFTSSIPVKFLSALQSLPRAGYMCLQRLHRSPLVILAWSMRPWQRWTQFGCFESDLQLRLETAGDHSTY